MTIDIGQFAIDPLAFVRELVIPAAGGPRRFAECMAEFQLRDFEAMAPVILALAAGGKPSPSRFWIERTKGASKDSDLACCLLWLLAFSPRPLMIQAGAADQDQADELRKAAKDILRLNPWLAEVVTIQAASLVNPRTESRCEIIPADAMGSHGARPDLLILNELTHISRREFAETLLDNSSKMPGGVVIIATNAGILDSWQASWRQTAIESDRWRFSSFSEPAPWLDPRELSDARRRNSVQRFARLWLGQWVAESGDALNIGDIDAAIDETVTETSRRERGFAYAVGADLGLSRDHAAVCVVGRFVGELFYVREERETERLPTALAAAADMGLYRPRRRFKRIAKRIQGDDSYRVILTKHWKPAPGRRIDLERVERFIRRAAERFSAPIHIDQWQAASIAERLGKSGFACEMISFTPNVLGEIAQVVLTGFADRAIKIPASMTDLVQQLRQLRAEERAFGMRLSSPRTKDGHGDVCSAFQLALLGASRVSAPIGDDLYRGPPLVY